MNEATNWSPGAIASPGNRCMACAHWQRHPPAETYDSDLCRCFNAPAGHASTYPARQLLPLEVREVEVGGDSQSGGRTPRVRTPPQPRCPNPEGRQDRGPAVARVSRVVSPITGWATLRPRGDGAHD